MADDIFIETLNQEDEADVASLLRRNIASLGEAETVLAASLRRAEHLCEVYAAEACRFYVAKDSAHGGVPIACVGLGPLHGLPSSEGVGEIRDLVVEEAFRGCGLGSKLLYLCIADAKKLKYKRLYLETSRHMNSARRLFLRTGFRPVTDKTASSRRKQDDALPGYFLMEDLT